jgi:hypothetical protein
MNALFMKNIFVLLFFVSFSVFGQTKFEYGFASVCGGHYSYRDYDFLTNDFGSFYIIDEEGVDEDIRVSYTFRSVKHKLSERELLDIELRVNKLKQNFSIVLLSEKGEHLLTREIELYPLFEERFVLDFTDFPEGEYLLQINDFKGYNLQTFELSNRNTEN